jgi:hypothetical protein
LHFLTLLNQFNRVRAGAVVLGSDVFHSSLLFLGTALAFESYDKKGDVYNMLWAVVFGFATLNILGLVVKRFEPRNNRMSFGEMMAVMTVVISVFLLGWEMLHLFKILPIRLSTR